jgi:hypothetical protein
MNYKEKFKFWKEMAAISHGKVNISGGNVLQHEIFLAIKNSGKHDKVYEDYPIPLVGKGKRKHHKVDILIVEKDTVIATNSKGKSFNSTDTEDAKLNDVKLFTKSIQKVFPNKKVVYQYLKDEYGTKRIALYEYFEKKGVPVYNTEKYLIEHYKIDFDALEKRRQKECVRRVEEAIESEDVVDLKSLYAAVR